MENAGPNPENQPLENNVRKVVEWMKLTNVPTARDVDPDGQLGIKEAFREIEGAYPDPVPTSVIGQAKNEVDARPGWQPINIPILKEQIIPTKRASRSELGQVQTVPLFKEQVVSAAQYLVRLGFEAPAATATRGDGFVLVGAGETRISVYPTRDPNVLVILERSIPSENAPVTSVELSVIPSQH